MKLNKCYVENFGCLQQFPYEFEEGLTTINEMNGWGKSTFAVFIRSMFYGMPKSTKKNLDENERVKYTPWNGNKMGGNLIFEVNGKTYKLERFFDKKEKDDTFVLYDYKTNMESKDFSSNIGEELFGIDLEAYAKSAYISQDSIEIGTNDSINAKLGNLLDSDNDINNFDKAIKNLKEAKKKYKMSGKRGSIGEAENKIAQKKIQLESEDSIRDAILERTKQVNRAREEKETNQRKLTLVKQKVGEAATYEVFKQKKKNYDELVDELENKNNRIQQNRTFFKKDLPTENTLLGCKQVLAELEQLKGAQKSFVIQEDEKNLIELYDEKIAEGVFSEETLSAMEKRNRQNRESEIKFEEGKLTEAEVKEKKEGDLFFKEGIPSEDEIRKNTTYIAEIHKLDNIIVEKEAMDRIGIGKQIARKNGNNAALFIFAILFLFIGIVGSFIPSIGIYGMLGVLIGLLLFTIFVVLKMQTKKNQKVEETRDIEKREKKNDEMIDLVHEQNKFKNELESFIMRFFDAVQKEEYMDKMMVLSNQRTKYLALVEKVKKIKLEEFGEDQKDNQERLEFFLRNMGESVNAERKEWGEGLQNTRDNYNRFLSLRKKQGQAKKNEIEINEKEERMQRFLENFEVEKESDYFSALEEIRTKFLELLRWKREQQQLQELKIQEEEKEDFKDWVGLEEKDLDIEILRIEEKELEEKKDSMSDNEKKVQDAMDVLLATADDLKEVEQEKSMLEEQLEKDQKRLEVIEGTLLYLEEAKELFSSHYLIGLRGSFEKYMQRIGDEELKGAKIDAEMEVKVNKSGALRKIDYFSRGNKDLINVCARFALVDALFENEKPFLIMDDTFVNFDEEKLKKILDLVVEISETYQVIYLVCHESRVSK